MRETFREWLDDRVGEGRISKRELARRLAADGLSDPESHRRSIRRILDGTINPQNRTREAIGAALEDDSYPRVEDEDDCDDVDAQLQALAREQAELSRRFRRLVKAAAR